MISQEIEAKETAEISFEVVSQAQAAKWSVLHAQIFDEPACLAKYGKQSQLFSYAWNVRVTAHVTQGG